MATTDPAQALAALREATVAFADAELDPVQALRSALGHLIRVTAADAGAVAVPGEDGEPRLVAERRLGGAEPVSRTVLAEVLADPAGGLRWAEPPESLSVVQAAITSILCAPVRRQGQTLAAVYLDRRGASPPFDAAAGDLAVSFAATLALSVDLTRRLEALQTAQEEAEAAAREAREVAAHVHDFWRFGSIATRSAVYARCLTAAERAARYQVDLLIRGETGTGKEHLARCIHAASGRKGRFVAVNCTALPESIAENELFGHEPGAYTGAARLYRGCVEQAGGGTLFLDEVGDLPPAVQPKLLRVLEDKRVRRIGGEDEIAVDVRIVAATNRDLEQAVAQGRFREDLYHRLQVLTLTVPPLRERLEDLPELAAALLKLACAEIGRPDLEVLQPDAIQALARHSWPGNVRELKNAIKQLCVLIPGPDVTRRDVETHLAGRFANTAGGPATAASAAGAPVAEAAAELLHRYAGATLRERVLEAEKQIIQAAIEQEGSVAAAARLLGLRRQTLHQRCLNLGLATSRHEAAEDAPEAV
jgi:DNA-binding NtrC family response regulator